MGDITITDHNYVDLLGFYNRNGHTITLDIASTSACVADTMAYSGTNYYYKVNPLFNKIGNASVSPSKFYNATLYSNCKDYDVMLFEPLCTNLYGEVSRLISKGSTGNGGTDSWNSGSGLVNRFKDLSMNKLY